MEQNKNCWAQQGLSQCLSATFSRELLDIKRRPSNHSPTASFQSCGDGGRSGINPQLQICQKTTGGKGFLGLPGLYPQASEALWGQNMGKGSADQCKIIVSGTF